MDLKPGAIMHELAKRTLCLSGSFQFSSVISGTWMDGVVIAPLPHVLVVLVHGRGKKTKICTMPICFMTKPLAFICIGLLHHRLRQWRTKSVVSPVGQRGRLLGSAAVPTCNFLGLFGHLENFWCP
ncbi:hypothetical protein VPH35_052096 [Triticum aestivum]